MVAVATMRLLTMARRKLAATLSPPPAAEVKMARYLDSVGCEGHQCTCEDTRSVGGEMLEMSSHAKGSRITIAMTTAATWMPTR